MTCGIYKITNKINGKNYIGQSVRIEARWKDELVDAFNKNSHSYDYPLQRAIRKYGKENFDFLIIEECQRQELNDREKYWIQYYDSFFSGYNQTLGGDSTISAMKENIIGIFNDLKNTDMFHKEIAQKWGVSIETVQGINTGRYWYQDNIDYPIQKRTKKTLDKDGNVVKKIYYCQNCGAIITKGATLCLDCYHKNSRKVERPSKEELFEYLISVNGNFLKAGRNYGVSDNAIRKWCKAYEIPYKSSDYKQKTTTTNNNNNKNKTAPKKIAQIDNATGEIINTFNSIQDAAKSIEKPQGNSHISSVCSGKRKTAYGYKWKYI